MNDNQGWRPVVAAKDEMEVDEEFSDEGVLGQIEGELETRASCHEGVSSMGWGGM
jgi:hypothetical protein